MDIYIYIPSVLLSHITSSLSLKTSPHIGIHQHCPSVLIFSGTQKKRKEKKNPSQTRLPNPFLLFLTPFLFLFIYFYLSSHTQPFPFFVAIFFPSPKQTYLKFSTNLRKSKSLPLVHYIITPTPPTHFPHSYFIPTAFSLFHFNLHIFSL